MDRDVIATLFFACLYSFGTNIIYIYIYKTPVITSYTKKQDISNINLLNIQVKYTYRSSNLNEVCKDKYFFKVFFSNFHNRILTNTFIRCLLLLKWNGEKSFIFVRLFSYKIKGIIFLFK
jgi:hypothetical protein